MLASQGRPEHVLCCATMQNVDVALSSTKSAIHCHPRSAKGFEQDESETKNWAAPSFAVHDDPSLIVESV